jgi:hypothetical protein
MAQKDAFPYPRIILHAKTPKAGGFFELSFTLFCPEPGLANDRFLNAKLTSEKRAVGDCFLFVRQGGAEQDLAAVEEQQVPEPIQRGWRQRHRKEREQPVRGDQTHRHPGVGELL